MFLGADVSHYSGPHLATGEASTTRPSDRQIRNSLFAGIFASALAVTFPATAQTGIGKGSGGGSVRTGDSVGAQSSAPCSPTCAEGLNCVQGSCVVPVSSPATPGPKSDLSPLDGAQSGPVSPPFPGDAGAVGSPPPPSLAAKGTESARAGTGLPPPRVWTLYLMEGVKYLPYGNWSPVATQLSTGVGVAAQPRGWPIAFTADFIFSFLPRNETVGATKTKLFADSIEATLGLQKVLDFGNVHPYAGVGTGIAAARVSSDLTTTPPSLPASTERSGGGFGGFVGGGTYYTVDGRNGRVCLGLAVRYSVFPFHATGPAPGGLNTAVLVGITF